MGKSIKEFLGLNSFNKDINGLEVSHNEIFSKIVNEIGLEKLVKILPLQDKEELKIKYSQDQYFNNIPLRKWDDKFPIIKSYLINIGITKISLSDTVCILKQAARMYIESK